MRTILRRLLLLLAVAGFAAVAQEAGSKAPEEKARAVETGALQASSSSRELSAAREAIEPNLPSTELSVAGQGTESTVATALLAQGVRRRAANNGVMDEIILRRTEITGNQELPKVLYIVPWRKSDPGDLTGKPINTLLDEVLAPIDRSEFIRQIEYYGDLYGEEEE